MENASEKSVPQATSDAGTEPETETPVGPPSDDPNANPLAHPGTASKDADTEGEKAAESTETEALIDTQEKDPLISNETDSSQSQNSSPSGEAEQKQPEVTQQVTTDNDGMKVEEDELKDILGDDDFFGEFDSDNSDDEWCDDEEDGNRHRADARRKNKARQITPPKPTNNCVFANIHEREEVLAFFNNNRWVVIESNADNRHFVSEAIAQLLAGEENYNYHLQARDVDCEEYIWQGDVQHQYTATITRHPIEKLRRFEQFFDTREQIKSLTGQLAENSNKVIFVVSAPPDNESLPKLIRTSANDPHAYWRPCVAVTDAKLPEEETTSWLDKVLLDLCIWLPGLPMKLLNHVAENLLELKCKEEAETNKELRKKKQVFYYHDLRIKWKDNPESVLALLGLANLPDDQEVDRDYPFYGVRFKDASMYPGYKADTLQRISLRFPEYWPYILDYLFSLDNNTLTRNCPYIFRNVAELLQKMQQMGSFTLTPKYLADLFDIYRYAIQDTTQPVHRFFDLIKQLNEIKLFKPEIKSFFNQFCNHFEQHINLFEGSFEALQTLLEKVSAATPLFKRTMPFLKKIAKEHNQQVIRDYIALKDRAYALVNLAITSGIEKEYVLVQLENALQKKKNVFQTELIGSTIYKQLNNEMRMSPEILLSLIPVIASKQETYNFHALNRMLFWAFSYHMSKLAHKRFRRDSFFYISDCFLNFNSEVFIKQTLLNRNFSNDRYLAMCLQSMTNLHFYWQEFTQQDTENQFTHEHELIRVSMAKSLKLMARHLPREEYRKLKDNTQSKLDLLRDDISMIRGDITIEKNTRRARLSDLKQRKESVLFIKKNFLR